MHSRKIMYISIIVFALCILTFGYAIFSQKDKKTDKIEAFSLDKIIENNINDGDLYTPISDKGYYFHGSDPSNYVVFADKCFRMVNINDDGEIKIIYEGNLSPSGTCMSVTNTTGIINGTYLYNSINNNWFENNGDVITIKDTLEKFITVGSVGDIILSNTNVNNIVDAIWYVGAVNNTSSDSINDNINEENINQGNTSLPSLLDLGKSTYSYIGKIGLLNPSDYVLSSTNTNCISINSGSLDDNYCGVNNYLTKNYVTILMNPVSNTLDKVWAINESGKFIEVEANNHYNIRPVFYLKSGLNFTGEGTMSNPYVII